MTSTTLHTTLTQILETPHILNEITHELAKSGISIVASGYLRGYLDCLVDLGEIHRTNAGSGRKIYSKAPVLDFTQKTCPYCSAQVILYQHDVEAGEKTCPKCDRMMSVVLSMGRGVVLGKENGERYQEAIE